MPICFDTLFSSPFFCHSLHIPDKPFHTYGKKEVMAGIVQMGRVVGLLEVFFRNASSRTFMTHQAE